MHATNPSTNVVAPTNIFDAIVILDGLRLVAPHIQLRGAEKRLFNPDKRLCLTFSEAVALKRPSRRVVYFLSGFSSL